MQHYYALLYAPTIGIITALDDHYVLSLDRFRPTLQGFRIRIRSLAKTTLHKIGEDEDGKQR